MNQETGGALVSAINYNAASQDASWTRAWGGHPDAAETFTYNDAGQLTRQRLADPATLVDVEYRYFSNNDGRLWQRKNWVSGEEVTYQYDSLGRLSAAATTSAAWGLSWTYDGFGNRLQQTVTKGQAPVHSVAVDPATNRMAGQSYDANGNMLIAGLVYDVENRMMTDGVWWYRYSWTNQRTVVLSAAETYAWFYGFGGELLGVYKLEKENGDANRTWPVLQTEKERVYALGRLMRMGSGDVAVDRGASVIRHGGQNLAYYPYGEEQVTSANDRAKYATYTRDATTGLDYAWNRMYKVEWGRFTTADPWTSSRRMTQPEGWNRFTYGGNDPVNWHDPPGLEQTPVPGGPFVPDGGIPTFQVTSTNSGAAPGSKPGSGALPGNIGDGNQAMEVVNDALGNSLPGAGGGDWQETDWKEGREEQPFDPWKECETKAKQSSENFAQTGKKLVDKIFGPEATDRALTFGAILHATRGLVLGFQGSIQGLEGASGLYGAAVGMIILGTVAVAQNVLWRPILNPGLHNLADLAVSAVARKVQDDVYLNCLNPPRNGPFLP